MKAKRKIFIGMLLGLLIGWAFGFLRLPYVEKNVSFWVGFAACWAMVALVIILLFFWNRSTLLFRLIGIETSMRTSNAIIQMVVAGVIAFGVLVGGLVVYRQGKLLENNVQMQSLKIREMSEFIDSIRKNEHLVLAGTILEKVDNELKNNPARALSDETIARLVSALNHSFKPYRYWDGDSLSKKEFSPGRGQLLLGLQAINVDSSSFRQIKNNASFSAGDLRNADLHGIDLSGANLKGANLKDANLSGANLQSADLSGADLWGANLNDAKLQSADLRRSNMSWSELNRADLRTANLNGANLTNAQLRKADLSGATFQWGESGGALLNDANLSGVDLLATNLAKANLSGADLTDANLGRANLREASLEGAVLSNTFVEEGDWLERLGEWRTTGAKGVQEKCQIADDTTGKYRDSKYRLEKIRE